MHNLKLYLVAFLIIAFSAISLLAQDQDEIVLGPYLQRMTDRSVTIKWSTLEGESRVIAPDSSVQLIRAYEQHEMLLSRLKADTVYHFNINGDSTGRGAGTFRTFPREIKPFKFVTLGDTRSRHDVHKKIVDRVVNETPLFVVNTGDLVSNGENIQDWEQFFRINYDLMRSTPYFPVLGNHEKDSKFYFDFFDLPGNERYYHFSVGDALFIILDSEGPDFQTPAYLKEENEEDFWQNYNRPYFEEQKAWLERMLSLHKDAGFIFVFMHAPIFSIKQSRLEGAKLRREFWGDIFERHGVQVFMNGHDHHYHHAIRGGTHYI
ncbi:MAG: hypothetical protein E4H13_05905, partial [Calditrichales bacterium]